MHRLSVLSICFSALLLSAPQASADNHRLGTGPALMELFDDADEMAMKIQYEFDTQQEWWDLRPGMAALMGSDSQYYLSAGLSREWFIEDDWFWGMGLDAGYFHNSGKLDYDLQFYSRLLLGYQMDQKRMVKLEFGHISNNGWGDTNPGTELLTLGFYWDF